MTASPPGSLLTSAQPPLVPGQAALSPLHPQPAHLPFQERTRLAAGEHSGGVGVGGGDGVDMTLAK